MKTSLAASLGASLVLVLPGQNAIAQSERRAQTPAINGPIEEIVVTARKREELIQQVPIAITAFTQADLDDRGVNTVLDLQYHAPAVQIQTDVFQQNMINVTIRGQRNFPANGAGNGVQFDTATAVYLNGIYLARTQGIAGALFDIDTVEILKGPQGTLVGRNATGGALLYTTKEPEAGFGGFLNGTAGSFGRRDAQGAINLPVSDRLAVRAAFSFTHTDGYLKNLYTNPATGARNTTPGFGSTAQAGQFSVKWTPDNTFKLVLRGDASTGHYTGTGYHSLGVVDGTVLSLGRPPVCNIPTACTASGAPAGTGLTDLLGRYIAPYYTVVPSGTNPGATNADPATYNTLFKSLARQRDDFWSMDQAVSSRNIDHVHTVSALVEKTFDQVSVKLVSGYRWFDTYNVTASRGLPYDVVQTSYTVPNYKAYTSELTLTGTSDDQALKWTAGLFFFKESAAGGSAQYLYSPNFAQPQAVSGRQVTLSDVSKNSGRNQSYAGYAQASYSIGPDLRLTAGARYTVDGRSAHMASTTVRFPATPATNALVLNSVFNPGSYLLNGIGYSGYSTSCAIQDAAGNSLPLGACGFDVAKTFKKPTWMISVDYDLAPRTMAYVTTRKGYKSGGINAGLNGSNENLLVARPENVQDYEVGIKSDWSVGDIPVRTNFDAYYTDYRDIQNQVSLPFVALAIGPGGGPCTQTAFNAGQCSGASTQSVMVNAKAAEVYGLEWEFLAKPTPHLTLGWAGSYLHAYFTDFAFQVPAGYLLPTAGTADLSGTPFPLPQWQSNASANYTLSGDDLRGLPVGGISFIAQWYWQSSTMSDFRLYHFPQRKALGYQFTDLRVNIDDIAATRASLSAFVTNVFNKAACSPESAGSLNIVPNSSLTNPNVAGIIQCVPLPPRLFGLTARYRF